MIDPKKIKKLILGTDEDRALANEYIKEYNLCIIPDEFKLSIWDLQGKYFVYSLYEDVYIRNIENNTWDKMRKTTVTASTTTKI